MPGKQFSTRGTVTYGCTEIAVGLQQPLAGLFDH
jgi:hypothetical protein